MPSYNHESTMPCSVTESPSNATSSSTSTQGQLFGNVVLHLDVGPNTAFSREWCYFDSESGLKTEGSDSLRRNFLDVWSSFLNVTLLKLSVTIRDGEDEQEFQKQFQRFAEAVKHVVCTISGRVFRLGGDSSRLSCRKDPFTYVLPITLNEQDRLTLREACKFFVEYVRGRGDWCEWICVDKLHLNISKYNYDGRYNWQWRQKNYLNIRAPTLRDVRVLSVRFCQANDQRNRCTQFPIPAMPAHNATRIVLASCFLDFPENVVACVPVASSTSSSSAPPSSSSSAPAPVPSSAFASDSEGWNVVKGKKGKKSGVLH
eukprot:GILI01006765.1.p1 GENE.GILI01006765.1~~GILI01006765.1.p1  ORF type:complete len:316 (-),score=73.51 GILI01006765.1:179-1126(-)